MQQRMLDWLHHRQWRRTNLPVPSQLTKPAAAQFVDYVLEEAATRRGSAAGGMAGERMSRQGKIKHLRGSDFVERLFVAVEAYRLTGLTIWRACERVAEHPVVAQRVVGRQPRRSGRRSRKLQPKPARGWWEKVENIRTLYYSFKRKPQSDSALGLSWTNWQFYKEHVQSKKLARRNRAVLRWF